jgi:sugar lactone lactonase YvrE
MPVEFLPTPRVLLTGLTMVEGGRWHDGRLWFAHWGIGEVVAVDLDGTAEVVSPGPPRMGWAFDWLPDGSRVTTGASVTLEVPDGTTTTVRDSPANEVVVDRRAHVFVDGFDFDFLGGGAPEPGWIDLVGTDGSCRRVAEDVQFPNGMVITPDGSTLVVAESFASRLSAFDITDDGDLVNRRVWAEGVAPDGIAIDAEGGIWAQASDTAAHTGSPSAPGGACVRVLDGGEITHRVETEQPCFACALGGPDGRSLFLLCNDFEGVENLQEVQSRRSARVLVTEAPVPRPS